MLPQVLLPLEGFDPMSPSQTLDCFWSQVAVDNDLYLKYLLHISTYHQVSNVRLGSKGLYETYQTMLVSNSILEQSDSPRNQRGSGAYTGLV